MTDFTRSLSFVSVVLTVFLALSSLPAQTDMPSKGIIRVPVVFSGGHETDPKDGGRPVILIAAALGVPIEVFREAFSHVHPARPEEGKGPEPEQARDNKMALMLALGKYGVTNDRLDAVSNYYRYVKSRGELWTNKPATANALVKDGIVTGYEVVSAGSGYSSPLNVSVPGFKDIKGVVELSFDKNLESNGSVISIKLP